MSGIPTPRLIHMLYELRDPLEVAYARAYSTVYARKRARQHLIEYMIVCIYRESPKDTIYLEYPA